MNKVADSLVIKKPREKSGSWTSARYDYQRHIAILKILELLKSNADWCVACDYFDDLMVLDHSSSPSSIHLYQVKTKTSGKWSISNLVAKHKGPAPNSFIGKMYGTVEDLGSVVTKATFISNLGYAFELKDGTKTNDDHILILASHLSAAELKTVEGCLEPDFPSPRKHDFEAIFSFERSPLGLHSQAEFVIGRLHYELNKLLSDADNLPIGAIYKTLFAEVSRRSGISNEFETSADFFAQKTISKAQVAPIIESAKSKVQFGQCWSLIKDELSSGGASNLEIIKTKSACLEHIVAKIRGGRIAREIEQKVEKFSGTPEFASCKSLSEAVALLKQKNLGDAKTQLRPRELTAALLVEAFQQFSKGQA